MEKYSVIVTDQAQEQLLSIKLYYKYKLNNPSAAEDFIDRMEETFIDLGKYPERGRIVEEEPWHSQCIHVRPVRSHLVYYWIEEDNGIVWVIAVIDGRMDQKKQLKKLKMK